MPDFGHFRQGMSWGGLAEFEACCITDPAGFAALVSSSERDASAHERRRDAWHCGATLLLSSKNAPAIGQDRAG
jgi:hypothetical protein